MLHPITFSIPKEKLCTTQNSNTKTKILSSLIPGDTSTYIYNTEEDYYNEYKTSYFAITQKTRSSRLNKKNETTPQRSTIIIIVV